MQPNTENTICLDLIEAVVTLYPANADGTPQLANPIWAGVDAENLHAVERWLKHETTPSGAPYPVKHPLISQYEVSIGRVWALLETALAGWQSDYTNFVLDVLWIEEQSQEWHRKTFYGVTINGRSWEANDVEHGLMENQIFDAQYMVPAGGTGTPPAISGTLPYYVTYTDATGSQLLYTYDPVAHTFALVGAASGTATINYSAGAFAIQFAADMSPVVSTTVNGLNYQSNNPYRNSNDYCQAQFMVRGGIFSGVPVPKELPKLDFFYGPTKVCTITQSGLYDVNFDEQDPTLATGRFGIYAGTNLIATLAAGEVDAKNFVIV